MKCDGISQLFHENCDKISKKFWIIFETYFWNAGRNFYVKDFVEIKKNFVKICGKFK